jgi:hypothetical protein
MFLALQQSCQKTQPAAPSAPPEPEAREVTVLREWSGGTCGVAEPKQVVIRDSDAWKSLWKEMQSQRTPAPATPDVDFSREMVVGVFLGQKPTGGYSVRVTRIEQAPDVLKVEFKETRPAPDSIVTQALTQPYHLVVVPKQEGRLDFALAP